MTTKTDKNTVKASKKEQYAIRMLDFHSRLAASYGRIVLAFVNKNKISKKENLYKYVERKPNKVCNGQLSIYDFIDDEKYG